jgi:tetratricopeptide (TPR) repeat protein
MKSVVLILSFIVGFSALSSAQKEVRKDIRAGNKSYKQDNYTDAEIDYRKALEKNAHSTDASYNLGNALYKQQKAQEALEQYQITINSETDKNKLAQAWHNAGNVFMTAKDYAKSVEAYKQSLRNNPKDDETRYNLALAQKLLQDQQNQDQQNQDQNQDQKQDQQKDQQQQPDQQKQQEQQQDQQQQEQQQDQMSKQNADQILDAMMQEEKNTQEKVKEHQMRQQQRKKNDKNW